MYQMCANSMHLCPDKWCKFHALVSVAFVFYRKNRQNKSWLRMVSLIQKKQSCEKVLKIMDKARLLVFKG